MNRTRKTQRRGTHSGAGACLLALTMAAVGCATGEYPDNSPPLPGLGGSSGGEDESGGEGETETVFEQGTWWCTRAPAASYLSVSGQSDIPITYPEGDSPEGCACAPDDVHDWLFANLVGNEVVVEPVILGDTPFDVLNLRNNVYQDTENSCNELTPNGAQTSNCNVGQLEGSALDADPTSGFQHPGLYQGTRDNQLDCSVARLVPEPDPECKFVDGSYGIKAKKGTYYVPKTTLTDFLNQPACLLNEKGRVDAGPHGYVFTGIKRGTLLWELGLRSQDVPVSINGLPLNTVEEAFTAYDALRTQNSWVVQLRRGQASLTLEYKVQ